MLAGAEVKWQRLELPHAAEHGSHINPERTQGGEQAGAGLPPIVGARFELTERAEPSLAALGGARATGPAKWAGGGWPGLGGRGDWAGGGGAGGWAA